MEKQPSFMWSMMIPVLLCTSWVILDRDLAFVIQSGLYKALF